MQMSFYKKFKFTMSFLEEHSLKYYIGIVGITIGFSSASLLEGYLLKKLMDTSREVTQNFIIRTVTLLAIYMVLIVLIMPLFSFFFNGSAKYSLGYIFKAVYNKILTLPMNYFEKEHSGSLLSVLINDTSSMCGITMRHFKRVVVAFFTAIIYLVPMLIYDWRITSILLAFNIVSMFINSLLAKKLKLISKNYHEEKAGMTTIFLEIISGISVIKMYQLTNYFKNNFNSSSKNIVHWYNKRAKVDALLSAYGFFISMMNMMVFIFVGYVMVQRNLTTYGNILAIMALQTALEHNIREFSQFFPRFYENMASAERIYDLLQFKEEEKQYPVDKSKIEAYLSFENVDFSYGDKKILDKFTLTLNKGEKLAIVGESGSGKSTLAKVLLSYYRPESGAIRIANRCMSDLTLKEVREIISYVPQNAYVFAGTVFDNIQAGNLNATYDEIIAAAKAANAHEFIEELDESYYTMIGENGINLSGGQRQRIAIARAIIKNSPILLLDEATSNLDTESERYIMDAINKISKEKTTIVIAHRLSTVEDADYVIQC